MTNSSLGGALTIGQGNGSERRDHRGFRRRRSVRLRRSGPHGDGIADKITINTSVPSRQRSRRLYRLRRPPQHHRIQGTGANQDGQDSASVTNSSPLAGAGSSSSRTMAAPIIRKSTTPPLIPVLISRWARFPIGAGVRAVLSSPLMGAAGPGPGRQPRDPARPLPRHSVGRRARPPGGDRAGPPAPRRSPAPSAALASMSMARLLRRPVSRSGSPA